MDKTLFIKKSESHISVAQVYVDDIIFGSTLESNVSEFARLMETEFEMSLVGVLTYFLGLQVQQLDKGTFVCQAKYTKNLIEKFGLLGCKAVKTPSSTTDKIRKDETGKRVDQTTYRSMIGSLLYLTASRPDIMQSVCVCARYQSDPRESHLIAVKRIIRYLSGTVNCGLWYSKSDNCSLVGFSDSDWAGCTDDRKSTSGCCVFVGDNLVSWFSKKQACVSISTAEAEYVSAAACASQLMWLKQMMNDYGIVTEKMKIMCDNQSAIQISKNPVMHSRTKHIDIKYHFLKDLVEDDLIELEYVDTIHQLADMFTKPLAFERYVFLRNAIGVCVI